ncbi:tRNA(Met) cytidine acetyltransferase [Modicisalibacter muralis]|uniref:tRNA(Met) cytidine acetyltransferase TmcA n=1 Tax=Modicisalibacter muralis TaxID=119000 RepID=A0A1G9QAH0_9GAMM|nr:GNAT family N-acetyltransferase [Halomonas muralis]SDM08068.1 tRNA(Met) cytidine acetyltransferase [Halomonas muralis]
MTDDDFIALDALLGELGARHQRALLWIGGVPGEALSHALALWRARAWQSPLWLGPELGSELKQEPGSELEQELGPELKRELDALGVSPLPAAKARTRLGGEHDLVVIDAVSPNAGFDPDAFGAVSGTLRAGGLLVLLTPPSWQKPWHTGTPAVDADYARLAAWPYEVGDLSARYLARLARLLRVSPLALHWPTGQTMPRLALPAITPAASDDASSPDASPGDSACLTSDQVEAVSRLTRLRRRRPLVLSADRGRGKSAALGIGAARRLLDGERRLWITAPRPAAVEPFFERLSVLLPQGRREDNGFNVEIDGAHAEVRFIAPDGVSDALQSNDIDARSPPTLFVDEAAAIPTPLLARWLAAFPRIAFATTVHGYEGTGRGFAVRFRARLERDTPDWREYHLSQPVRWAEGDPLEALTRELLLLDAEPAADTTVAQALNVHGPRLISLDRAALAADERALSELFGLLVQAHYRTTPADLRQLLDGPDVRLLATYVGERCVGVCLAQDEGGFPPELAAAIWRGERRPRGHLLAQSLATHGGHRQAAEARWCRIARIAVHPAARRRGLGSALIEQLATSVADDGIERLGVSFGGEVGLIDFWRAQGFVSLRLGLSREASSGEHALMMGRALHESVEKAIGHLAEDFQRLLPSLLAHELTRLEPELAAALLSEGEAPALGTQTLERIEWFALGGGELALARPWLAEAWLVWWRSTPPASRDVDLLELVAPLFQGGGSINGGVGRKARLARWRALAGRLHCYLER